MWYADRMSFGSTMQFLRTGSSSGCGPIPQPLAGSHTHPVPGDAGEVALYRGRADGIEGNYRPEQFEAAFQRQIYDQGFEEGFAGAGHRQREGRLGFAGDVVGGPPRRKRCRPRAPWGGWFWGAHEPNSAKSRADMIRLGKNYAGACGQAPSMAGAVIRTRKGTVVTTRSGVAGFAKVGSIPQTRG